MAQVVAQANRVLQVRAWASPWGLGSPSNRTSWKVTQCCSAGVDRANVKPNMALRYVHRPACAGSPGRCVSSSCCLAVLQAVQEQQSALAPALDAIAALEAQVGLSSWQALATTVACCLLAVSLCMGQLLHRPFFVLSCMP